MRIFNQRNYNLLRELVITDFKLRYQGSVLGYLWSLAKPMMLFGVLYVVFSKILRFGGTVPYFPVYLLLGIVLWTYFTESTSLGLGSIVGRGDLIRKISMPKYIIVLSTSISAFINLIFNLIVVGIFMVIMHVPVYAHIIYLPLFLLELLIFCASIAFLLSALFVRYRDITYIWEVVLQVLFYATPIIYPMSIIPPSYARIVSLSPLTQIIQDARYVTITPKTVRTTQVLPGELGWIVPLAVLLAFLVAGTLYFRARSGDFAEEI